MNDKNKKRISNGSYSILITVIVVIAAVFINLMVGILPSKITQFDFSSSKLYTLTDTSEKLLSGLNDDVTLYYICEGGEEDDTTSKLLERYKEGSSHIKLEQIDPVLYPGFTSKYTEDSLPNNSVIAVNGDKSRVVNADDIYITEYDYTSYSYVTTGYDGEGLITSAIDYVTSDNIPVFYYLYGNGESSLADDFYDAMTKNNIDVQQLNLLSEDTIPDDCAALIINAPTKDYTDAETKEILSYLENGGKALIFSNYTTDDLSNFYSILADYGVAPEEGIILEGDSSKYMTYQYCILPAIEYSAVTADVYSGTYIMTPMCQGIKSLDTYRDSITQTPLLDASSSSYSKVDVQNMTTSEKEDGDIDGPFTVGMLIQEDINNDSEAETEIVYYTTSYLMDADYNANVAGGNAQLISGTIAYLRDGENGSATAVASKSIQYVSLSMTSFTANFWTVICVFILPIAFIAVGFVIWFRRRKN